AGNPFGVYNVIFRIDDGVNQPVVVFAGGTVNLVPNPPPTAEILFPPPAAATDATQLTVTGRSEDVTGTRFVRVNGEVASTTDRFKTWQIVVDLIPDQVNVVTVETQDDLANTDPAAATLFIDTRVGQPVGSGIAFGTLLCAAFDPIDERVIALDGRVIAVDFATSVRTLLSGGGPAFQDPVCVRLDAGGSAFVVDGTLRAVFRVDSQTGDRFILSDDARGAGPAFVDPRVVALNEQDNSLVVLDGSGTVLRVDIPTGDRRVLSGSGVGVGPDFVDPVGLALDPFRPVAYVTDRNLDAVFSVDFAGGQRQILSALGVGTGTTFVEPGGLAIDPARNRALVADAGRAAIIGVSLFTGDRTIVSGPGDARGTLLVGPVDVTVDVLGGRMFVTDPGAAAIYALELVNGDRVVFSR
ncbi:MAG: hypothetical protein OER88_13005, partial [Planctomycetota bacterium]|nr:hypothetical protein [Planctomycetota bacterium]